MTGTQLGQESCAGGKIMTREKREFLQSDVLLYEMILFKDRECASSKDEGGDIFPVCPTSTSF